MNNILEEIHPGEILMEEFIEPMQLDRVQLAAHLGITAIHLEDLVQGRAEITEEIARQLGAYFDIDPQFWWNLALNYADRVRKKATDHSVACSKTHRPGAMHASAVVLALRDTPAV